MCHTAKYCKVFFKRLKKVYISSRHTTNINISTGGEYTITGEFENSIIVDNDTTEDEMIKLSLENEKYALQSKYIYNTSRTCIHQNTQVKYLKNGDVYFEKYTACCFNLDIDCFGSN